MKVIVTGGRDYADRGFVYQQLDQIHKNVGIEILIQGGATGADALALDWAKDRKVPHKTYEAKWKDLSYPDARIKKGPYGEYDANAGHRRNYTMLYENQDALVLVFPGGHGTKDCVQSAMKLGMNIA